jgi:transposase
MITQSTTAGCDVSKAWLDVAHGSKVERIDNRAAPVRALARKLIRAGVTAVGLEPTGGYERLAVETFRAAGLRVLMVDSWRCRQFAKAMGTRAKTDPLDARLIASFLAHHQARPFPEPSENQAELAAWVREIARAEADIQALLNRRDHIELEPIRELIDAEIATLRQTVARAEAEVDTVLAKNDGFRRKAEILDSVPGVGRKTIRVLLAEMPELGSLDGRSAGALAGLAPYQRQSGKSRKRAHVEGGRGALRRAAYLAAMAAKLHNPWAKALYRRLRAAGKPAKVALIALARRLITVLNAMLRDGTPWRDRDTAINHA